ncbi:MAG: glycosyltransferase family A protein [Longimicrobiales bacterium]
MSGDPERVGESPRVSVVLPTRNRADLLGRAVASALAQTVRDIEVIVVDDASDDDTPEAVAALGRADLRVRGIRRPEPGGAPAARNAGIDAARGDVVAFLDDDCLWHPDKLEKQLEALTPGRGLVYCRHAIRHDGRWVVEGEPGAARDPVGGLLRKNYIGTYSILVRRDLLETIGGFDEVLPRLQDWDLLLRLARHTRFAYVPELLVHGEQLPSGITMDRPALATAADRMISIHGPGLSRRQRAALHYGLAKYLLVDGLGTHARRFFFRALRLDPASPLHWAGAVAGLLGPTPARWVRAVRRSLRTPGEGVASLSDTSGPTDRPGRQ